MTKMGKAARNAYLETVDSRLAPIVMALDRAILAGRPDLDVAVKYRMLMYGVAADFRHWVCAIGASNDKVYLRFLYGVRLSAPAGTLRPGSTTMGTIDLTSSKDVDGQLVGELVNQAVARVAEAKAGQRKRTK